MEEIMKAKEFSKHRSKLEERKYLNNLNKEDAIKYKVKGSIDNFSKKCFILLQAGLASNDKLLRY